MALRRSTRNKKAVDYAPTAAAAKAETRAAPKPAKGGVAKTAKAKAGKAKASGRRGLSGHAAPNSNHALGRIDPASGLKGRIHTDDDGEVYDVMLNLVDVSKNHDKYFLLQLVETGAKLCKYSVFTRWGRTGTAGACKTQSFSDRNEALSEFATKFEQKTGTDWAARQDYVSLAGKYLWVQKDHVKDQALWAEDATWQYWVDDRVDGKADGWYDYDPEGSEVVEQLYHDWSADAGLHERVVASGAWEYHVDLAAMTQTNAIHAAHKMRHIRRWTPQLGADQTPPGEAAKEEEEEEDKKPVVAPKTPSPQKRKRAAPATPATPPPAPAPAAAAAKASPAMDPVCGAGGGVAGLAVHDDFSAMLNQTNVGANNNKFYRLQLLTVKGKFYVWTRWGRVGELGQYALAGPMQEAAAIKAFHAKFRAKTANDWDDRADFTPHGGKYDLVEVEEEDEKPGVASPSPAKKAKAGAGGAAPASALDAETQELVELIFSEDMFKSAMADMELDVKKMPLGALSQAQVQKGYAVLAELEEAVKAGTRTEIERLTGRFYTVIPHSFGRQRPPLIQTEDQVKAKFEMCNVLSDIETAQGMLKETDEAEAPSVHPLDEKYASLHAALRLMPETDPQFKLLQTYCANTAGHHGGMKLQHVWEVEGEKDGAAFAQHAAGLSNHKLLWHGTNVAVVAAILNGGLRIMPHSGGRVGAGIYLASERCKSAGYVRPGRVNGRDGRVGVMFLVQAALGKPYVTHKNECGFKAAPKGYHSVLAKGQKEPDPKKDKHIIIDGAKVAVPQGKPVPQSGAASSHFDQSEYLVYNEAQQRLRYVLTFSYGP